jgi:hypothetical protein
LFWQEPQYHPNSQSFGGGSPFRHAQAMTPIHSRSEIVPASRAARGAIANTARERIAGHLSRSLSLPDDERQSLFTAGLAQAGESAAVERALCAVVDFARRCRVRPRTSGSANRNFHGNRVVPQPRLLPPRETIATAH